MRGTSSILYLHNIINFIKNGILYNCHRILLGNNGIYFIHSTFRTLVVKLVKLVKARQLVN